MSPDFGRFALALALAFALAQVVAAFAGTRPAADASRNLARHMAIGALTAVALSFAGLIAAFLASDFSVANVVSNSHIDKPWPYKVAGAWGNHEGSMLLWCLALTASGAGLAWLGGMADSLRTRALVVVGAIEAAYLTFTLFASSPFERLNPAPLEGAGLNPLLQDPALALHPPLLYFGYVGLAAPFALAVAALWEGEAGAEWARAMRPWVLGAFGFLSFGITLGSYWAYYELGWGGWWFWDPVENSSLTPWLASVALLHSIIVTEKRGGTLGAWTALLAILAFTLSMLGTFLVRSGVLTSVHAFAVDPERGAILLTIHLLAAGAAFTLFALRGASLSTGHRTFGNVSREAAIVANNVFLISVIGVIELGTLFPIATEALAQQRMSVGAPYFERTALPLMAGALLLVPLATLLGWGRGEARLAVKMLRPALVLAVAAAIGLLVAARGAPMGAVAASAIGAWLLGGAATDMAQRAGFFRQPMATAWRQLGRLSIVAYASALSHAGIGCMALGAGIDAAFPQERHVILAPGEQAEVFGRTLAFTDLVRVEGANYIADRAILELRQDERVIAVLQPEQRTYPRAGQTTSEVAIRSRPHGDFYVALSAPRTREDGVTAWSVRVLVNPMIWLVFVGGACAGLGGALALAGIRASGARARRAAAEAQAAVEPAE